MNQLSWQFAGVEKVKIETGGVPLLTAEVNTVPALQGLGGRTSCEKHIWGWGVRSHAETDLIWIIQILHEHFESAGQKINECFKFTGKDDMCCRFYCRKVLDRSVLFIRSPESRRWRSRPEASRCSLPRSAPCLHLRVGGYFACQSCFQTNILNNCSSKFTKRML